MKVKLIVGVIFNRGEAKVHRVWDGQIPIKATEHGANDADDCTRVW